MRTQVWYLASLSGLRIRRCCELWCKSQTGLGSQVAVAVVEAGGYNSNSTPGLGNSIYCWCSPRKIKTKQNNNKQQKQSPRNSKTSKSHLTGKIRQWRIIVSNYTYLLFVKVMPLFWVPCANRLFFQKKKKKNFKHDPTNYVNCVCILTIFSIHLKIEDYTYIKFEKSAQIMCTIEFTFLQWTPQR